MTPLHNLNIWNANDLQLYDQPTSSANWVEGPMRESAANLTPSAWAINGCISNGIADLGRFHRRPIVTPSVS
jgi:hypothetical protein